MSSKQAVARPARAKHDSAPPAALVAFMMRAWEPRPKKKPAPIAHWAHFAARRRRLASAFVRETLIIPTGHEKIRANDTTFRFRAGSDFYYLVGNTEPDCVLVLVPSKSGRHRHVLYVEPNPGRKDPSFFTDRVKGELWVGPRAGVRESKERYRVDECRPLSELETFLQRLVRRRARYRLLRGLDAKLEAKWARHKKRDDELATAIAEMRLTKDPVEVAALVRGAEATRLALEDVIALLPTATNERQLECAFDARARCAGNDVGYGTIIAAGANACVLHWTRNDSPIIKTGLVLIDAGVESTELYTADITRTLPASGRFTRQQRELYDLVMAAHAAAIAAVKPGHDFLAPHRAATQALALGLERLGILPMSAAAALDEKKQYYKRYTLHGTSHMLGLDVHDCERASAERYRRGKLEPGMVLTIEPGLYFQKNDLTVPKRYRGIGIRVEDDVLVTARGHRILTDVPRTADDVEGWMREVWAARQR